ncbi:MAG TPA: right-handed parallel beta-helix repeat-containing protein [Thermoanaerobaculia bacterium]|nr:right-handed parallel beta-helix repeat-containing protein [Thermoanaerobaculia bacterium]
MRDVLVRSLGTVLAAALCAAPLAATTRTVTNTNDSGAGSLRQAILDSNAAPGFDIIEFSIPGPGVHTIATASPLPVTDGLYIDGYSQPGASGSTTNEGDNAVILIELQGSGTDGLTITGGAAVIHGLSLYGFQTAIALSQLTDVVIAGNFVGVTAAGSATPGNAYGITITSTDGLDRIGDTSALGRNVISGNTIAGIHLSDTKHKQIEGNIIGLGLDGHSAAPNGVGVKLDISESDTIGGPDVSYANIISGNTTDGILVSGEQQILIQSNFIGTDVDGEGPLPNGGRGIRVEGGVFQGEIRQNEVSGNAGDGLSFHYSLYFFNTNGILVYENAIGCDVGATPTSIPNGGAGIWTQAAPSLAVVLNTIAFNPVGIWETAPTDQESVTFDQNRILSNHGLGIVIGPVAAIVPNTPEGLWNFPVVEDFYSNASATTVDGRYFGPPNTDVFLEFFSSPPCAKPWPKQFDEGAMYLGSGTVSTDGNGNGSFSIVLPILVTEGTVTATATATVFVQQGGMTVATSHTSGFSQRLVFSVSPPSGDPAGASLEIAGTNFADGCLVTFDGDAAASSVVDSATQISATSPVRVPGAACEVAVNVDGMIGRLPLGFVADFLDVPPSNPVHAYVITLASDGITGGVGGGDYGVVSPVLRQQMAVFLLKAKHGSCYAPPPCAGTFADVPCPSPFADWIERLSVEGITGGCGGGNYCPQGPVRRDQMAAFLLKAEHGATYVPPPCGGTFADVACPSLFADWIERLAAEGVTAGCGGGNYCPLTNNTRGQMAVFLTKTFQLP